MSRTHEEMGRLLHFVGADDAEEAVGHCVESASFEKRSKGRRRGEEDSSSPVRKGIAGDWKNVFTERDKEIFKEAAEDLLVRLGYEADNNW